jgi:hypothetical protein
MSIESGHAAWARLSLREKASGSLQVVETELRGAACSLFRTISHAFDIAFQLLGLVWDILFVEMYSGLDSFLSRIGDNAGLWSERFWAPSFSWTPGCVSPATHDKVERRSEN